MKDYGTESYKLVRTDDPETSQDSAEKVDSATWEKQMHDWVKSKGLHTNRSPEGASRGSIQHDRGAFCRTQA